MRESTELDAPKDEEHGRTLEIRYRLCSIKEADIKAFSQDPGKHLPDPKTVKFQRFLSRFRSRFFQKTAFLFFFIFLSLRAFSMSTSIIETAAEGR